MGVIVESISGRRCILESELLVGRGPSCGLEILKRYVSSRHAVLRWMGSAWEVKDLGSRNGTYVDGMRLKPAEERHLPQGSRLAFGKLEEEWQLVDDAGPRPMAVPLDGEAPVVMTHELLALPNHDHPLATIYRDAFGSWVLEKPDASGPIVNQQVFEVGARNWRFSCTESVDKTSMADLGRELESRYLQLAFHVSRDEEHVLLQVTCGEHSFDLGSRTHHYLLLTLARARLADAATGLPEAACGWIYQDDLAHDPSMSGPQLNLDVFRARKQFADIGVYDAANIIERRLRTKQLRLGTPRIVIVRI